MLNGGIESLNKGSGHADTIKVIKSRPDMVLKAFNELECKALEELSRHPRLAHFAPSYFGKHTIDGSIFMVMSNLLFGASAPHTMDIKIGLRTFQEDEVANDKTRMDLLKKMMDIDPMEPTEDEKTLGITKLRYYTVEFVPLPCRMCSLTNTCMCVSLSLSLSLYVCLCVNVCYICITGTCNSEKASLQASSLASA